MNWTLFLNIISIFQLPFDSMDIFTHFFSLQYTGWVLGDVYYQASHLHYTDLQQR